MSVSGFLKTVKECEERPSGIRKDVVRLIKNFREHSWMSDGVIRFRFLLNSLFILALFNILALFSTSCVS